MSIFNILKGKNATNIKFKPIRFTDEEISKAVEAARSQSTQPTNSPMISDETVMNLFQNAFLEVANSTKRKELLEH